MNSIEQHIESIKQLCVKHKVKSLFVFGSLFTDRYTGSSDIDLLVEFETISLEQYADNYYDFKFALEKILEKQVDLLEMKAITNPYFRQAVDRSKQVVYAS